MAEVQGMPAKILLDPRVDPQKPRFLIEKGAEYIQHWTQAANSASTSNINWNVQVPNDATVVDRKMFVDLVYYFNLTGADLGVPLVPTKTHPNEPGVTILDNDGTIALRFLPWQSNVETLNVTINGENVSQDLQSFIQPLVKFGVGRRDYQDSDWSIFPSMEDQFQNYSEGNGTNRNPLADYGDVSSQESRGSFYFEVSNLTNTTATLKASWSEPLILSPLLFSKMEEFGFLGVTNFKVRATTPNLSRMLSIDGVNRPNIETVSVSLNNYLPEIRMRFLTPPALDRLYLDPLHHYPYYNIIPYETTVSQLTAGQSATLNSNNYQLSSIPKRVCIVVRKSDAERIAASTNPNLAGYGLSDGYCRINSINITWDNKSGLLSNANSRELFSISVRNGSNQNWYQWYNGQGGVLMLDFAHDIGLKMDQAVGLSNGSTYQFKFDVNVTNITGRTITSPLVQAVVIYEGMIRLSHGKAFATEGDVFPRDVIEAMLQKDFTHLPYYSYHDFQGGSFWGAVKRFGQRALEGVKKGYNLYKEHEGEINKAIGTAAKFAPLLLAGLGEEEQMMRKGGARMGGAVSAGAMGYTGGKIAKRKNLRKRL